MAALIDAEAASAHEVGESAVAGGADTAVTSAGVFGAVARLVARARGVEERPGSSEKREDEN